ncbi:MAG: hypothetical protein ABI147_11750 [Acidobacteriaceae bacterium]
MSFAGFETVEKIAAAILYEGYILYPYRPSAIKNRQRWNFGTLYPRVYAEAQRPQEPFRLIAECLVAPGAEGATDDGVTLDLKLQFLQLLRQPHAPAALDAEALHPLSDPSLGWEEAVERASELAGLRLSVLVDRPLVTTLSLNTPTLPEGKTQQPVPGLDAALTITVERLASHALKVRLELQNATPLPSGTAAKREEALPQSFVSAHMLLGLKGGEFVSLLDPPEMYKDDVAACANTGVFPVLAGEEPDRSMMLVSPIILYDYPKIAPESEGDFFDGTEMDEMLTLRVLTLTDAEKEEMRNGDPRARRILERTESLTNEEMMKAHGAIRSLREIRGGPVVQSDFGGQLGDWNPLEEAKAAPECVRVFGVDLRVGDRVRLWPQKNADIIDMALKGKVAVIEAIEQDFEDQVHFAVVLDDDPGREFGMMRQPGHRFFYSPDEVEPVTEEGVA